MYLAHTAPVNEAIQGMLSTEPNSRELKFIAMFKAFWTAMEKKHVKCHTTRSLLPSYGEGRVHDSRELEQQRPELGLTNKHDKISADFSAWLTLARCYGCSYTVGKKVDLYSMHPCHRRWVLKAHTSSSRRKGHQDTSWFHHLPLLDRQILRSCLSIFWQWHEIILKALWNSL